MLTVFFYDYPEAGQKFFQDPATPVMEGIIDFHHDLTGLLIAIGLFVCWMLYRAVRRYVARPILELPQALKAYWNADQVNFALPPIVFWFKTLRHQSSELDESFADLQVLDLILRVQDDESFLVASDFDDIQEVALQLKSNLLEQSILIGAIEAAVTRDIKRSLQWEFEHGSSRLIGRTITHHTILEVVWTIVPAIFLLIIAIPSFALLYAMDELVAPVITLKVVGRQWYWQYEYSDHGVDYIYESRIVGDAAADWGVEPGFLRLLDVDKPIVLPEKVHVRVLITATDVLHSFAIPSLGIKLDACPGRLNQTALYARRIGVFYGQCSEICGVNHAFMPIAMDVVSLDEYLNWYLARKPI